MARGRAARGQTSVARGRRRGSDPAPTSYFGRNNFGRTSGLNRHRVLIRKGSAIASGEIVSERIHSSLKNLEPRRPATLDTVRHRLFGQKRGQIQAGVLMNGHRIPAQQQEPVAPVPECYAELARARSKTPSPWSSYKWTQSSVSQRVARWCPRTSNCWRNSG